MKLERLFFDALWGLLSPVIVLGGIYTGLLTPTEAAAVAVIYSFIVGAFIYKELTLKNILGSIVFYGKNYRDYFI